MHGMHQELKADTNRCTLMMKRAISVVLFLISVKAVPGQSLSGTVTDTGDVPVPYASVIILSVPDSSFVSGTACDSAGRFDIAKSVTSGLLWVSSVGYRDRYLHFGSGTSGFGTVRLETETGLIRNAAVTASMPLVQVRGNVMETIVEGSRLERAGTGEDLLSKIPGISVKDGKVSVFGGGNVAMDAARTAVRVGFEEVNIIYRRTEKELPARLEEIRHAKEEGVVFKFLYAPKEIVGEDGYVKAVELEVMELGEPDESGRRRPVSTGKIETMELDTVIVALGTGPNPIIQKSAQAEGLEILTDKKGYITVDDARETNIPTIYAGGDVAPVGESNAINAMGAGKKAAKAINELLK